MGEYRDKTNWLPDDPITEDDLNRWEKGIKDAHTDINQHKTDHSNPHRTTKSQVGLGNVDNVKQASKVEFDAHVNNKSNPHGTTKTHVGLENVDNVKQASKVEFDAFLARRDNPHQVTTEQVNIISPLAVDAPSTAYPLGVSSFQITGGGWPSTHGSVLTVKHNENRTSQFYFDRADTEANTGVWVRSSHTSGGWKKFRRLETEDGAQAKVDAHANNKNNPHAVNSEQVNIISSRKADVPGDQYPNGITMFATSNGHAEGYPENLAVIVTFRMENYRQTQWCYNAASSNDNAWIRGYRADSGWNDFSQMETTAGAQAKVNAHANDKGNPHGVTKSQVGLGNVPNFPVSSQAQAEAGNHTESFMTPQRVRQFAAKYGPDYDEFNGIVAGLGSHISDKSNPHGVTKAQVGLGSVPNWGGATQAEAQAGTNNAKIMTPLRTKEAFNKFSTDQDTGWITLALHSYLQPQGTSPRVRRIGNTVYLEGTFKNVLDTDVLITVLPDEFRPGRSLTFPTTGQVGHGTVFVTRIDVQSNGRVIFIRSSRQWHGEYEPENWYNLDGIIYTV